MSVPVAWPMWAQQETRGAEVVAALVGAQEAGTAGASAEEAAAVEEGKVRRIERAEVGDGWERKEERMSEAQLAA